MKLSIYLPQNKTMKKNWYIHVSCLPNSKYIKDILKCLILHQLYTIRDTNIQM